MARNIEYYLAWLVWSKTKDGSRNQNAPSPRPRPEKPKVPVMALAEDDNEGEHIMGGKGVSRAEMAARLGWAPPPEGED